MGDHEKKLILLLIPSLPTSLLSPFSSMNCVPWSKIKDPSPSIHHAMHPSSKFIEAEILTTTKRERRSSLARRQPLRAISTGHLLHLHTTQLKLQAKKKKKTRFTYLLFET